MKAIILAAGQGTRLLPLTNDKPKCLVKYNNKTIVDYILETLKSCAVHDIAIVGGYKIEVLQQHLIDSDITFFSNPKFDKSNMVATLFAAKEFLCDDIIISYADIIYKKEVLEQLLQSEEDFSVVVDKDWQQLWSVRMDNPLDDVETLKIKNNKIIELGRKTTSYSDIEGQYIGLIKISKRVLKKFIDYYFSLDRMATYDNKDFDNMYMTSLIQLVIDNLLDVTPIYIKGGWIEIDSIEDLSNYTQLGYL